VTASDPLETFDLGGEDRGLNFVRLDEIGRLADLAASYWRSVALAADRGDLVTIAVHVKQVVAVTKSAVMVVGELDIGGAAS
jgi:hypothetical protein